MEYIHIDGGDDKNSLRNFMTEKGYTVRAEITDGNWRANDYIFVKNVLPYQFRQSKHCHAKLKIANNCQVPHLGKPEEPVVIS